MRSDLHRPTCPCGWTGAACSPKGSAARLAAHQAGKACTLPKPDLDPCTLCGIEPGQQRDGLCRGCAGATVCRESPLDIGGRWVTGPGGIKKWVAA